jgi:hypothetical protein
MTIPASTAAKNYYIDFEVESGTGNNAFKNNLGGSGLVEGDDYPVYCSGGLTTTTTASVAKILNNWVVRIKATDLSAMDATNICSFPLGERHNVGGGSASATISSKFIMVSDPRTPQTSYGTGPTVQTKASIAINDIPFVTPPATITTTTPVVNGSVGLSMEIKYAHTPAGTLNTDQWQIIYPKGTQVGANSNIIVRSSETDPAKTCTS